MRTRKSSLSHIYSSLSAGSAAISSAFRSTSPYSLVAQDLALASTLRALNSTSFLRGILTLLLWYFGCCTGAGYRLFEGSDTGFSESWVERRGAQSDSRRRFGWSAGPMSYERHWNFSWKKSRPSAAICPQTIQDRDIGTMKWMGMIDKTPNRP